jgi:predicted transcriptional regulator
MSKRRSKDLIFGRILEVCSEGASKTRIVYASNTNFGNAKSYLAALTKKGLIEKSAGKPILYKTTEKGLGTLQNLRAIQDLLSDIGT